MCLFMTLIVRPSSTISVQVFAAEIEKSEKHIPFNSLKSATLKTIINCIVFISYIQKPNLIIHTIHIVCIVHNTYTGYNICPSRTWTHLEKSVMKALE